MVLYSDLNSPSLYLVVINSSIVFKICLAACSFSRLSASSFIYDLSKIPLNPVWSHTCLNALAVDLTWLQMRRLIIWTFLSPSKACFTSLRQFLSQILLLYIFILIVILALAFIFYSAKWTLNAWTRDPKISYRFAYCFYLNEYSHKCMNNLNFHLRLIICS